MLYLEWTGKAYLRRAQCRDLEEGQQRKGSVGETKEVV